MNKDLTTGKPEKVLWQFCLPLFGSIIFQQLYNIADSFVAGKFISDNALAAVGNSYEITLIFIAFAFGCNIACSVIAALFFGAKQYEDLKTAVYTALIASSAVCILLMLVGMLCSDGLLRLIKTPGQELKQLLPGFRRRHLQWFRHGIPLKNTASPPAEGELHVLRVAVPAQERLRADFHAARKPESPARRQRS